MLSYEDYKEHRDDTRDVGIPFDLFQTVQCTKMMTAEILSFDTVFRSEPDLAQFLVNKGLVVDPSEHLQSTLGSCLQIPTRRIVHVQHSAQMCLAVPIKTMELPARFDALPGLYTFVVDVDATLRFILRYKRQTYPGEIGSKHVCLVGVDTRLVLAGEISVLTNGTWLVNLQSGTFMKRWMSTIRSVLIRNMHTDWMYTGSEDAVFGLKQCVDLWWKPMTHWLFPGSSFTLLPLTLVSTTISLDELNTLYHYDPQAITEFMTNGDCGNVEKVYVQPYHPGQKRLSDSLMSYINTIPDIHATSFVATGGQCTVFRGRFGNVDCAFKVATSPMTRRHLLTEFRYLNRLGQHPHIVRILDDRYILHDRVAMLVMQYYPHTIASYLSTRRPHEVLCVARRMTDHVSQALDVCHRAGLMHLDVSIGNILCDDSAKFVLSDYGMMRPCTATSSFQLHHATGTDYESPLIMQNVLQTFLADWHSLMFVVHRILYGILPWETMSPLSSVELKTKLLSNVHHNPFITSDRVFGELLRRF
jgi:hypothetical protein